MTIDIILKEFDARIAKMQHARAEYLKVVNTNHHKARTRAKAAPKKRRLSPAARKRIADAQRKRWAKQKKAVKAIH